jgi:hypothetical protein
MALLKKASLKKTFSAIDRSERLSDGKLACITTRVLLKFDNEERGGQERWMEMYVERGQLRFRFAQSVLVELEASNVFGVIFTD